MTMKETLFITSQIWLVGASLQSNKFMSIVMFMWALIIMLTALYIEV